MEKLENTDKGLTLVERVLGLVKKYSIFDFIKSFFLILIIAGLVGFISHPTYIFEKYQEWQEKEHAERIEKRMKNNEKLHIMSEKLLYKVGAKRVMILELHNGLENNAGMPFSKCSATYEALNENVKPISDQYQNTNLSLMPFASYLFEKGYWCGDVEDLKEIDRGLYFKMKSNETEHLAACVVEGVEKPLAFIFVSFDAIDDKHQCIDVRENIRHIALESALLLELGKR
jgi:hypothetical protein